MSRTPPKKVGQVRGRNADPGPKGVLCVPCGVRVPPSRKNEHRATRAHEVALYRCSLADAGWRPLTVSIIPFHATTAADARTNAPRELIALSELLRHAGVQTKVDVYAVQPSYDEQTGTVIPDQEETQALYVPTWVEQLIVSKLGPFEMLRWIFELAGQPDAAQVASTVAAMLQHHDERGR